MEPIEEIKQKLDIVAFIAPYVPLKQAGRNFKGLCPFHKEKTPSFMVSPERQVWHCFGCSKGGDVISFYQEIEHLEFYEALQNLAERTGVTLHYQEPEHLQKKQRLIKINELAAKFYRYLLLKHKVGEVPLRYLNAERKLLPSTIKTFQIGYAPGGWDKLYNFLKKRGVTEKEMQTAGLVGRGSRGVYDLFRERIMFPIHNHRGDIVAFAGRVLVSDAKTAKYINTPETPIYTKGQTLYGLYHNAQAIREAGNAILVEGELDMLSSYQAGVKNIVAMKGTALTEAQIQLLRRFTQTLLLALDQDTAGQAATRRSIELAQEAGLTVRIVSLPFGKDVDDLAKVSPKSWQSAVAHALPYYDWLLDYILASFDLKDPFNKQKAAETALPYVKAIENDIIKEYYLKKLAKQLDTSYESLIRMERKMVAKSMRQRMGRAERKPEVDTKKPHDVIVAGYLVSLLLQSEQPYKYADDVAVPLNVAELSPSAEREILKNLWGKKVKGAEASTKSIFAQLPNELQETANVLYLKELEPALVNDHTRLETEIKKTTQELQKFLLKKRLSELTRQIAKTPTSDTQTLKQLSEDFEGLKSELKAVL